jgi:Zn-dependent alcohol dehydrogenase
MTQEIQAAVMNDFNAPLTIESLRLKEMQDDHILVRLVATGVCHTDLSVLRGALPYPPPLVLGHEGAGIVEEVGRAVTHLRPGDHVLMSWVRLCGRCHYCLSGTHHLCEAGVQAAIAGQGMTVEKDGQDIASFAGLGAFANKILVPSTAAIKIDDDIPLTRACLVGCSVLTGVGAAINTAKVRPGQTVAVLGCGGIGLNVIQGAAIAGAAQIIAVDLAKKKLDCACKLGPTETLIPVPGEELSEQIREKAQGLGVDYAFEAVGSPEMIRQAFLSTKRGGKAVVVGVAGIGLDVTLPACMISLEERSIIGSLYGSAYLPRDIPRIFSLYRQGRLKLDELVSREVPLNEINSAFSAMETGEVVRSVVLLN